jgi:hypothetical protein
MVIHTLTIIYNSDQSDNRTAIEANIGETYGITGIPAYDNTVDGFVETWYDQSGNGNDATQATAGSQPKIVSNGSLVTGGIVFDTGKTLAKTGLSISSPLNTFVVSTADTEHNGAILKLSNSSQQYRTSRKLLLQYTDLLLTDSNVYTVGEQNLQSFQFVAGTSVGFFNGTQVLSGTTAGETVTEFRLGNTGSFGLDGKINEAIIYLRSIRKPCRHRDEHQRPLQHLLICIYYTQPNKTHGIAPKRRGLQWAWPTTLRGEAHATCLLRRRPLTAYGHWT